MTRTILITGGGGGIGRATALEAARRGWAVGIIDRDGESAERAAAEARRAGARRAWSAASDVADEQELIDAFGAASTALGPVDGVTASAGIEINAPLPQMPLDTWRRVLEVNLTGTFLTVRTAAQTLRDAGRPGSIVCVSSPSAFVGFAGGSNSAYGASKGGVSAFVRAAAIDLAPHGIRVNAVVPGATDTPLLYFGLAGDELEAERARLKDAAARQIPLGRMADPIEIARAATWLLSDDASYVTGSHLVCDGGLMAKSANDF
ncbi:MULTISPECIES: SDR family NAD(P)-dependent oxidoreductase [Streptomyces]|uniref:NAD(P)-dependent dehydrogenase (Short-subunit alcohol dehydrogenase family) n=2 Tax=Streptomyces TaxID=1883 RepID=A0ABT9L629_9ACTN|nr:MULTISPECIES: SDR family NAD(P)-dependent oxidoreductase [Streptomyces]MBW8091955.1 SDR family oxidoreductase [Streptomyces hygroscopicus subsp. hygroscopicus]MCO8308427.1 SDR family oxidoreductase [Streptomyces sp. RKCA744]MDN3055123.1 SDR family NAD(P)-dependent oxidoreductase [Streptomyces sp. SRF1]MDP9616099.1 NAD(P)-dependent dehydrogenase (short-subunit alcohol dehydrogenase family) [Streptomyces demainii]GHJ33986.1 oxidoreductase [Streptomyces hygroscopicus]